MSKFESGRMISAVCNSMIAKGGKPIEEIPAPHVVAFLRKQKADRSMLKALANMQEGGR